MMIRVGYGFDVHKFGGHRPFIIGGVRIPFFKGIQAHSDGDVMIHALIDAILGATCYGDIGRLFPDTNDKYYNIDSRQLLRESWKKVTAQGGYTLGNADITLVLQFPKIKKYISQMLHYLSEDLNCLKSSINIKATTTETLGYIGRSDGVACMAIVLLYCKATNNDVI